MSKDHFLFVEERAETAYLAGAVDVLSDRLEMCCEYGNALDADVFYVKDNDLSVLDDAVKKRLHSYKDKWGLRIPESRIDSICFDLKKVRSSDVKSVLCGALENYCVKEKLSNEADEFLSSLRWYLQEPLGIYVPAHLPDRNIDVLGDIYLYTAWDYFFIDYYDYLVLIIIGTVE